MDSKPNKEKINTVELINSPLKPQNVALEMCNYQTCILFLGKKNVPIIVSFIKYEWLFVVCFVMSNLTIELFCFYFLQVRNNLT